MAEKESKSRQEEKSRLKNIEEELMDIKKEQENMEKALGVVAKQLEDMKALRGELSDTHGAISELNRTMNDMHEICRQDLVKLIGASTPGGPIQRDTAHICKRWQRFSSQSSLQGSQNRGGGHQNTRQIKLHSKSSDPQ